MGRVYIKTPTKKHTSNKLSYQQETTIKFSQIRTLIKLLIIITLDLPKFIFVLRSTRFDKPFF